MGKMEKFGGENSSNIKKPNATQLDINFEDVSNNSDIEGEKKDEIDIGTDNNSKKDGVDTGEKEDSGNEYYGRFNGFKKNVPPSKKQKTQREKDDAKIRAIKRAIEKGKDKDRKTGYEHFDPLDPNL